MSPRTAAPPAVPASTQELQLAHPSGEFETLHALCRSSAFFDPVLARATKDIAPMTLWSLDEAITGALVVAEVCSSRQSPSRARPQSCRGVRIKRRLIEAGSVCLAFSHDILEQPLARRGPITARTRDPG